MDLEEKIQQLISFDQLEQAIEMLETALNKKPATDFHEIIGSSFIPIKDGLFTFLDNFYLNASKQIKVNAIYAEMNGFSINTDIWFIQLFGFSQCGDISDTDWLADFEYSDELMLPIMGLEKLQAAFQNYMDSEKWRDIDLTDTRELCEWLIILRLQQAFREAKTLAKEKQAPWSQTPLFVTAHDYELLYRV